MKKTGLWILAALLILSLAACSGTAAESTEAAENNETAAAESAAETVDAEAAGIISETAAAQAVDEISAMINALDTTEPEDFGKVISLGEYKGVEVSVPKAQEVTDEQAESYLKVSILPGYTEEADVVQDGDTVNIDYEGKENGVAFDGGTAKGSDLVIGSGSFIDGFESGLIGVKKGETVDLNLTFPEDYGSADLAGHEVVFTVTVNSIRRQRELNDELAAEIDPSCQTVAELVQLVKEYLQKNEDMNEKQALYYAVVQKILENSEVEPSAEAVDYTVNRYLKNQAASIQQYGIDMTTFLAYYGMDYEQFRETYREYSEENVKQRLILQAVADAEDLKVSDADMEVFAAEYGYSGEMLKQTLGEDVARRLVREELANKFIADQAKVTYTDAAEAQNVAVEDIAAAEAEAAEPVEEETKAAQ